jgi:histidinol-phosphate/aromatic aminotransferase/cobyric acid decarboxylase-like protein/choline kinase
MQAVILAAGYGRRMRPLSDACHKALLPVGETTILARLMDELVTLGVEGINVVTGYRADEVEGYLNEEYPAAPLRFIRNPDFASTNNVVSLSLALDRIDPREDLLLVECDLLLAEGLLGRLCGTGENLALVDRYRTGMDGTVVTVADGGITGLFPTDLQDADFDYRDTYKTLNVYRFSADFLRDILRPRVHAQARSIDGNAFYEAVLASLPDLAACGIRAEVVDGDRWAEVDDPNDLVAARFGFEPDQRTGILDRAMGGHWSFDLLDFSFMRNAYFPTEAMLAAMRHALPDLLEGYGSTQVVVDQKLGWFLGCDPNRVATLHGASQAYPILRELWRGRTAAIGAPTFGEYTRVFPDALTYRDAPGIDLDELDTLARRVDVVVVVNPNNPTGTTLPTTELVEVASHHSGTTFLVDESFIDFSGQPSVREIPGAGSLDNLVVICSLSKSLGVPGLRLGYLYSGDLETVAAVREQLPIWNLSSPAEHFLELLLKFRPQLQDSLRRTIADRDRFRTELLGVPAVETVHPSGGNFLLVELGGDPRAGELARHRLLSEEAIEVKDVTSRFDDGVPRLRLAVKRPDENARLVAALKAHLAAIVGEAEALT